ncbi:hypothetical protein HCN44_004776 [Aphidius gifuensis]|uniref:Uncharacterized protein n=1 Tax=Aphidius gifuensis TaxID=684658 RepID=A0A834XJG3_APHGI|nr:hypothetical protein HCN44_004776 [Aphidius gifuensis]
MHGKLKKKIKKTTEDGLLVYFNELNEKYKPSTMYSRYSMLRTTILRNEQIDIATYTRLKFFLKKESVGYRPTKSKAFTAADVERFLNTAPEDEYLAIKKSDTVAGGYVDDSTKQKLKAGRMITKEIKLKSKNTNITTDEIQCKRTKYDANNNENDNLNSQQTNIDCLTMSNDNASTSTGKTAVPDKKGVTIVYNLLNCTNLTF